MQANLVKPAALAGQHLGVVVRVDAEMVECLGLEDLTLRLTRVNWDQKPEDRDQRAERHEVYLVLWSSHKHSVSGALLKRSFSIKAST